MPNPEPFSRPGIENDDNTGGEGGKVDIKAEFGTMGLQIIVKLANIHLTLERSAYEASGPAIPARRSDEAESPKDSRSVPRGSSNIRVISTASIPCQQRGWWGMEVASALKNFPVELRDKIVQDVGDFPIILERAKELREELMAERKEYVMGYQAENFSSVTISLCEH
ncbi:hypothetical protein P691DRAFT_764512 [Macrolepiota fuliginosa MF-IS2]|uniref:Uncharacterized protein n=1 Tax=Macrolepiota fuliginosa MF-IS2 TaxID=1400762 RepID=A0A9P6BXK5_9AGAR|nr:hypothetical protein P691DRAFT_764512 [Macrolepiota fuliginosa MF-IS2]